jgi:hypothetical protein
MKKLFERRVDDDDMPVLLGHGYHLGGCVHHACTIYITLVVSTVMSGKIDLSHVSFFVISGQILHSSSHCLYSQGIESSFVDDGKHLDDFLLSGSSPLGSSDITNAIVGETPNDTMDVDAPSIIMEENTSLDAQDNTPADDSDNADEEGEPPAELWDLVKIYTAKDILKSNAVKCMGDKCRLVACSIWSSTLNPKEPCFLALVSCCVQICVLFYFSILFETTSHRPSTPLTLTPTPPLL